MTRDRKLNRAVGEQAAEAWETFHGTEEASPVEHRDFGAWMVRSPENIEAYVRVSRTMRTLKAAHIRWPDTPVETLIREAKEYTEQVVKPLRDAGSADEQEQRPRIAPVRFAFAMAAMILIAVAAGWFVWMTPQTFETGFGEQRFVRLNDGSGLTLNTASTVEVKLGKSHRVIRLIRGEALFDVAHDAARPFDVYTGQIVLRAVGTRFDVDVRDDRTTVTIVEGVVSLTHGLEGALPQGNTPLLHASDRVVIDAAGPAAPQHGVRLDEVVAWTQQQLVFNSRPLGEVAEEFNRYNREIIVIESSELRSEEISGVFKANDPASFVAFLANIPGVRIRDDGRGGHVVTLDAAVESRP